jgi:hypothetical protein
MNESQIAIYCLLTVLIFLAGTKVGDSGDDDSILTYICIMLGFVIPLVTFAVVVCSLIVKNL